MARWKRAERATAKLLGTTRIPNNGRGQPDCVAGPFAVEHNLRRQLPAWLWAALAQATRNAGEGQTPIVVLSACGGQGQRTRRVVVLELGDWLALHGPAGMQGERAAGEEMEGEPG